MFQIDQLFHLSSLLTTTSGRSNIRLLYPGCRQPHFTVTSYRRTEFHRIRNGYNQEAGCNAGT